MKTFIKFHVNTRKIVIFLILEKDYIFEVDIIIANKYLNIFSQS